MKLTVDLSHMPPTVQAGVRHVLDALTQAWPGPLGDSSAADETGLPTPPTAYPRPVRGQRSYVRPRIMELLEQHPEGLTSVQIREALGLDRRMTSTLHTMCRAGLIHRPVEGLYVVGERS